MPTGACTQAVQVGGADCTAAGGVYQGNGTTCAGVTCPQPGACCMPDGTCVLAAQIGGADCAGSGGTYQGNGTTCTPGLCLGACCLPDGTCQVVSETACAQQSGDFFGIGSVCSPGGCLGACCEFDGTCTVRVRADCEAASGAFQGPGTTCGLHGCSVLWDNGPLLTGSATGACAGGQSLLQYNSQCLNNYGYNAATESSGILADDFVLNGRSKLDSVFIYGYETSATEVSITAAVAQIHSAQPTSPGQFAIATTSALVEPVGFIDVYRQAQNDSGCTRRLQRIVLGLQGLVLNPGTYWISFHLTGGPNSGPWVPPVTILGAHGKPGSNAIFSSSGAAFQPVVDAGHAGCTPAPPNPNPQDLVFVIEGRLDLLTSCCMSDGSCSTIFESACAAANGVSLGSGISCNPNPCGPGACCLSDGACSNLTPVACAAAGGISGALGTPCEAFPDLDADGNSDVCDTDDDADGVPDATDVCPQNALHYATDSSSGRPLGDMNGDCHTNGEDIAGFVQQLLSE